MEVCDHVRSSMVIGNDNAGSLVYASWVAFGVWVGWCGRRNLNSLWRSSCVCAPLDAHYVLTIK